MCCADVYVRELAEDSEVRDVWHEQPGARRRDHAALRVAGAAVAQRVADVARAPR